MVPLIIFLLLYWTQFFDLLLSINIFYVTDVGE